MLESITVNAETVEEAIEKGCQQLDLAQSEVEVRVINEGKKGFLGFGRQDAVVEISAKNKTSLTEMMDEVYTKQTSDHKALSESDNKEQLQMQSNKVTNESFENQVFEEGKLEETDKNEATQVSTQESIKEENTSENVKKETDCTSSEKDNTSQSIHEVSEIVTNYLIDVIKEYGAESTIDFEIQGSNAIFNIDTDKSGLIIGKHGKIINSLQVLAQTLLHHHYRHRATVTLNVGDYRDRRANILEQMAQRTADDVLKTKQPVILDSLPAYERKQIHAYLSNIDHISTHSEGKDPNRYLVVEYVNE